MSGYIYLITMEPDEYVKIGYTRTNPAARMASLQTGCPTALHLRGYFPGTMDDERRLHDVFAPLRWRGEWFVNERKLRDFVLYFDDYRDREAAPRGRFEDAMHDCVMQSMWFPGSPYTQDEYDDCADWQPFRAMLWNVFGPWED